MKDGEEENEARDALVILFSHFEMHCTSNHHTIVLLTFH